MNIDENEKLKMGSSRGLGLVNLSWDCELKEDSSEQMQVEMFPSSPYSSYLSKRSLGQPLSIHSPRTEEPEQPEESGEEDPQAHDLSSAEEELKQTHRSSHTQKPSSLKLESSPHFESFHDFNRIQNVYPNFNTEIPAMPRKLANVFGFGNRESVSLSLDQFKDRNLNTVKYVENTPPLAGKRIRCEPTLPKHTTEHLSEIDSLEEGSSYKLRVSNPNKPKNKPKYLCTYCGKQYASGINLKNHQKLHFGEKGFKCEVCGKMFSEKGNLNTHIRIHTKQKPYCCSFPKCKKKFTTSGHLKDHERIHTGERPYECGICEKKFMRSSTLKVHLRSHSGEKPYKCKICDKVFTESGNLKTHIRKHTGETPFECIMANCKKRFKTKGQTISHLKIKQHACDIWKLKEEIKAVLCPESVILEREKSVRKGMWVKAEEEKEERGSKQEGKTKQCEASKIVEEFKRIGMRGDRKEIKQLLKVIDDENESTFYKLITKNINLIPRYCLEAQLFLNSPAYTDKDTQK